MKIAVLRKGRANLKFIKAAVHQQSLAVLNNGQILYFYSYSEGHVF